MKEDILFLTKIISLTLVIVFVVMLFTYFTNITQGRIYALEPIENTDAY